MCRELQWAQSSYWSNKARVSTLNKRLVWEGEKLSKNDKLKHQAKRFYVYSRERREKFLGRSQEKEWEGVFEIPCTQVSVSLLNQNGYFVGEVFVQVYERS